MSVPFTARTTWASPRGIVSASGHMESSGHFRRYRSSDVSKYSLGKPFFGGVIVAIDSSTSSLIVEAGNRTDGTVVESRYETDIGSFQVGQSAPVWTSDGWRKIFPCAIDQKKNLVYYDAENTTEGDLCFALGEQYHGPQRVSWGSNEATTDAKRDKEAALARVVREEQQRLAEENRKLSPSPPVKEKKPPKKAKTKVSQKMHKVGLVLRDDKAHWNKQVDTSELSLHDVDPDKVHYRGCASPKLRKLMEDVFYLLDSSGDGKIGFAETMQALGQQGAEMADKIEESLGEGEQRDHEIDFNEWTDYWESTASGQDESKAVQLLCGMLTFLKNDCTLDGVPLSLGAQAEAKAKMMTERRDRLRKRRQDAAEQERQEREAFSAQMAREALEVVQTKEGTMLQLEFRSATPRLTQLINEVFVAFDKNGDNQLSFPEVLSTLGEFRDNSKLKIPDVPEEEAEAEVSENTSLESYSGPTSQYLNMIFEKDGLDTQQMMALQWDFKTWRAYWESTKVTEQAAIGRLSAVKRRMESQGSWDVEAIKENVSELLATVEP